MCSCSSISGISGAQRAAGLTPAESAPCPGPRALKGGWQLLPAPGRPSPFASLLGCECLRDTEPP